MTETLRATKLKDLEYNNFYQDNCLPSVELTTGLQEAIESAIQQLNMDTAVFLAELYYTECQGLPVTSKARILSVYLYSLALYLNQDYLTATEISGKFKGVHLTIAYIFARCCLKLSKDEKTACLYLVMHLEDYYRVYARERTDFLFFPHLSTIHSVIGKLYQKRQDRKSSVYHHTEALQLNRLFWESYTALALMKVPVDLKKLFPMVVGSRRGQRQQQQQQKRRNTRFKPSPSSGLSTLRANLNNHTISEPVTVNTGVVDSNFTRLNANISPFSKGTANKTSTATATRRQLDMFGLPNTEASGSHPRFAGRKSSPRNSGSLTLLNYQNVVYSNNPDQAAQLLPPQMGNSLVSSSPSSSSSPSLMMVQRRGLLNASDKPLLYTPPPPPAAKLFSDTFQSQQQQQQQNIRQTVFKTPRKSSLSNLTADRKLANNNDYRFQHNDNDNDNYNDDDSIKITRNSVQGREQGQAQSISRIENNVTSNDELNQLFYTLARILILSSQHDSYRAIRIMASQLPEHLASHMPWCLAQLGKLHFDILNYDMAYQQFKHLRNIQPATIENMEIYSTLLWHLQKKVELETLGSELLDMYPNKPQTWCALGNYFSLQKQHKDAIKAFARATTLDPEFAYAYTLQGHEYAGEESFEAAKRLYRRAISCDAFHYNAYYGLGSCASQIGKHEEALLYFEKARMLHPTNVVLICCCGSELEKLQYDELALQYYELACSLQPSSALAKYRRAELLFSMGRFAVAMTQFEELIKLDSENPNLHFILGKIYQTMGRKTDAIREYTVALNLDPKGSQYIMDALEKCHMQE